MLMFRSPSYLSAESWDDVPDFYDSEILEASWFQFQIDQNLAAVPNVSKRSVRLLQQSFVENFLGWLPIFDPMLAWTVVNNACHEEFNSASPENCLAMLMLGFIIQLHALWPPACLWLSISLLA